MNTLVISKATLNEANKCLVEKKHEVGFLWNTLYSAISESGPPELIKQAEQFWFEYGGLEDQIDLSVFICNKLHTV